MYIIESILTSEIEGLSALIFISNWERLLIDDNEHDMQSSDVLFLFFFLFFK
jgi:hypothetical protein